MNSGHELVQNILTHATRVILASGDAMRINGESMVLVPKEEFTALANAVGLKAAHLEPAND